MPTLDVLTELSVADERNFSVKQSQFKQTAFSCAPIKRPEVLENMNIYDAKRGHLWSIEVTHIHRGSFHAYRCNCEGLPYAQKDLQRHPHDCRWHLRLMEDYPSVELSSKGRHLRHFLKEHGGHAILPCPSHVGIKCISRFPFKPTPSGPERKRSQMAPIMKSKIKLVGINFKIAGSDVFWREDSRSGLKSQISKHLVHFLTQKLSESGEFPDFPRILKILTVVWPKSGLNVFRFKFWDQIWSPVIKTPQIAVCFNVWQKKNIWLHNGGQLRPFSQGQDGGLNSREIKNVMFLTCDEHNEIMWAPCTAISDIPYSPGRWCTSW